MERKTQRHRHEETERAREILQCKSKFEGKKLERRA